MITTAELLAFAMLASLILYTLLGGADFGGGVWDLFAFGPRASRQRVAIERAMAPVWEANHVWLILVIVILFTAFPPAFAAISISLHVPLTLMLLGIVFRGSAFVFRQYGGGGRRSEERWGRVFAVSSTGTPIFLGAIIGAITAGGDWFDPFPLLVGFFTLALFALLAAVYLTNEPNDPELAEDFRLRAIIAGVVVAFFALASGIAAGPVADRLTDRLLGSWWSWPLQIATGLSAIATFAALARRWFRAARIAVIVEVSSILLGWGAAQYPFVIANLPLDRAAAPEATLDLLVPALVAGSLLLFPSLYWMMRVFKSQQR